jgi:hypothetical protein
MKTTDQPKTEQVGGKTEGFTCAICFKLYEEHEGRMSNSGLICDNCEEEPNFKNSPLEKTKENTNTSQFLNTFTNQTSKSKEKAVQITNIEELNNKVAIPPELNIIDCPPDINPDPN